MLLHFTFWMCCYNILQQRELQVAADSPAPGANVTNGSGLITRSTDGADVSWMPNNNSSSTDIRGEESTFGTGPNTTPGEAWNITAPHFDTDGLNNVTSGPKTTDLTDDKMWVANITGLPTVKGSSTPAAGGGQENSTFALEHLGNDTLSSNTTPDPGLSNNMTGEWLPTTESSALENNHTTKADVLTTAAGMNGNGTSPTIESKNVTSDTGHLTTVIATPGPTELSANSSEISQNTSSYATDADVFTSTTSKATSTAQSANTATTPMGESTTRVGEGETTASANTTEAGTTASATTDDDIKAAIPPKRGDSKALLVIVLALSIPALVIITVAIIIIIVRRRVGNGDKYSVQDAVVESQMRVFRSKEDADLELQIKAQSYYSTDP